MEEGAGSRSNEHHRRRGAARAQGGVMHVAFGMLGFAAVLAATVLLEQKEATFSGLFYRPALLLLCVGPLFISLISHKVDELAASARTLWKAVRFSAPRSRAVLQEEVLRFAAEVRRGRTVEALAIAEEARHDLVRQLAPLLVKQYSPEGIERTAATAIAVLASAMKRSEDVLTSLARVAPAVGLVGTTLGLITLLRDLRNFEHLGPSMALALLCTLYGLVLANGVYQPLARLVHVHAVATMEEARIVARTPELKDKVKTRDDAEGLGIEFRDALLFDSGSAKVRDQAQPAIAEVARLLGELPGRPVIIEGHTDEVPINTGSFHSNWELSSQRAINVLQALHTSGVARERMSARAYADTRPLPSAAEKDVEQRRASNRRVVIRVE